MYSSDTFDGHMRGQRYYSPEESKYSEKVENASWFIQYGKITPRGALEVPFAMAR
jgi:hypothetical protein